MYIHVYARGMSVMFVTCTCPTCCLFVLTVFCRVNILYKSADEFIPSLTSVIGTTLDFILFSCHIKFRSCCRPLYRICVKF